MKYYPKTFRRLFFKGFLLSVAALVAVFGLLRITPVNQVNAAQISSRSILMSSSNSASPPYNTVTYQVRFTAASSYTVKAIVVDFCSNDPIIGDATCTAPTGFDVGTATPTIITSSGTDSTLSATLGTGWTSAGTNLITGTQYRTITITNSTGVALTSGSSVVSFDMTNVTNPTTVGTFYARILTYTTTTTGYAPGSEGSYSDYGGVAMSTAALITITAKVQEQITFCVFTNGAANCAGASGSSVTLGDTHGVLYSSGPFVDKNTQYIIATNAAHGAVIDIKAAATLTSGGNYIAAINAGSSTPAASSAGTSQFGLCSYGTGITVATTYGGGGNCGSTTQTAGTGSTGGVGTATFGFNTTALSSTYGDQLASVVAASATTGTVAFLGNIIVTQPAGVYTALITFIATGTY